MIQVKRSNEEFQAARFDAKEAGGEDDTIRARNLAADGKKLSKGTQEKTEMDLSCEPCL
jgi:hypothetical protein